MLNGGGDLIRERGVSVRMKQWQMQPETEQNYYTESHQYYQTPQDFHPPEGAETPYGPAGAFYEQMLQGGGDLVREKGVTVVKRESAEQLMEFGELPNQYQYQNEQQYQHWQQEPQVLYSYTEQSPVKQHPQQQYYQQVKTSGQPEPLSFYEQML